MYNSGSSCLGCTDCPTGCAKQPGTGLGLGIAPMVVAAAVQTLPAVTEWLTGHSSLYQATVATIPVYGQEALKGDVSAYIVLRAWSGDQVYCRYAIDYAHEYYLGTQVGQNGPCGAADGSSKAAARAQWQAVDQQRPDVKATALALVTGQPVPAPTASSSGQPPLLLPSTGGQALASLGLDSNMLLAGGAVVLAWLIFSKRGR